MSQRRRGRSSRNTTQTAVASNPQVQADHDLTLLGVANITRAFSITDYNNGPSAIFRQCTPGASIIKGFSASDISAGDTTAAIGTAATPTDVLNEVTPMAKSFVDEVWPSITQILAGGTGSRYPISRAEFTRYIAMSMNIYSELRNLLVYNHLTYHFDWTKIFPFTGNVPKYLYDICDSLDLTDTGLASRWLPLFKRAESMVMFPNILGEIRRQLTPFSSAEYQGRLMVPTLHLPTVDYVLPAYAAAVEGVIVAELEYMEVELSKTHALLNSFLPFQIGTQNPWEIMSGQFDIMREMGWWNSGVKDTPVFGDTGDPTTLLHTLVETDSTTEETLTPMKIHTRFPQPTWAEVKNATIYNLHSETLDDTYALLSFNKFGPIGLYGDSGLAIPYDGADYADLSNSHRYEAYANSKFVAETVVEYGKLKPGYMPVDILASPLMRMQRQETGWLFSVPMLRGLAQRASGQSLRELRATIASYIDGNIGRSY